MSVDQEETIGTLVLILPHQEIADRRSPWACPTCGSIEYWTKGTAHREDGTTIRLRQCTRCGAFRSTEELVLGEGKSPFFGNADDRRAAARKRSYQGRRVCRWCGESYQVGSFGRHARVSKQPAHADRQGGPKKREYSRLYQRRRRAARLQGRPTLPRSKGGRPRQGPTGQELEDA